MKQYRHSIKNTLKLNEKFKDDADHIENLIYIMSMELSKEYEDKLEDIYTNYAYEKIGEFFTFPDKKAEILLDIKNKVLDWNSHVYIEISKQEINNTNEQIKGPKIQPGLFRCKNLNCKSNNCSYKTDQTRSLDEGQTIHVTCEKCGTRYTIH